MALSEDQRAMLRLLAQREQGYDDIAALMGLSVDEVRARVREALDQIEAEGEEPPRIPDPEPEPPAETVAPPPPPVPAEPVAAETPRPSPSSGQPQRPQIKLSIPRDPGPRAAIVAGTLVLVALIVILVVGGGDDGSSDSASTAGNAPVVEGGEGGENEPTGAVLEPVDGSGASGKATFGRVGESLALQLDVEGLEPTGKSRNYTIWIAQSPQRMLPLTSTRVGKSGKIEGQFEVPVEVLGYLAAGTFDQLAITRTEDAKLQAALKKASSESKEPSYTGTEVLRGTITGPIVGAAAREEEANAE